ncbi:MAG TPA: hypothetical protein VHB27_00750 [Rhodopila sp.]|uniref:hypothetical protein n=1 Tax=Rhodopila sp. TaxID=2480087 RepID=UPI002C9EA565|nr:hypothetical protein [Rhodopila sp.]HVY13724.1 hypothetical protein [Rhodopila sp.]
MFDTLSDLVPYDTDYPPRVQKLDLLNRVLDGTIYNVLPYHFHEERSAAGEYIPLRQRRPSVRYPLCRTVVEDSVSLLFSDGHFPTIHSNDVVVQDALASIIKEIHLNNTMIEAAIRGSVGSVALLLRILQGRIFVDVLDTTYLTPSWDRQAPDRLAKVVERYKVSGSVLESNGYEIDDPDVDYWFTRQWDASAETWFMPRQTTEPGPDIIDESRSVTHKMGCVPIVWIKNLPGRSTTGDPADGACTFSAAIHSQVEIDYQLSQVGRGLKYSSDPTLLLKDPALPDGELVKGAGNALIVSDKGDARLLEIGGTASAAVIEYVRTLREFALESIHGNRASPERLMAAQSGRALELLNQGLISLADNLRTSYGENGLLELARLILRASQAYNLTVFGQDLPPLDPGAFLNLMWPRWYPTTADDRQKDVQSLASLTSSGLLSRDVAQHLIADIYDLHPMTVPDEGAP